jgi:AhpD family alkylhydroperoxidase
MVGLERAVRGAALEPGLLELVRIRASQINGCAYCLAMHNRDARARGEHATRLDAVAAWQEAPFFDERYVHIAGLSRGRRRLIAQHEQPSAPSPAGQQEMRPGARALREPGADRGKPGEGRGRGQRCWCSSTCAPPGPHQYFTPAGFHGSTPRSKPGVYLAQGARHATLVIYRQSASPGRCPGVARARRRAPQPGTCLGEVLQILQASARMGRRAQPRQRHAERRRHQEWRVRAGPEPPGVRQGPADRQGSGHAGHAG